MQKHLDTTDTIVAIATAHGRGGVGVVRISGDGVPAIAAAVCGRLPSARLATLCSFVDGDGEAIDSGLVLYFPAPHSYTGEHVLELQGHGGRVVLEALVTRVLQLGARRASLGNSPSEPTSTTSSISRKPKRWRISSMQGLSPRRVLRCALCKELFRPKSMRSSTP
jgi:hypothetical protein